ncbi:MAG: nucleotide pyrophosphohydrolase [Chloroflexota bacterium]|nr:nucleotide pyrophosphohydrolase [Chloroflexota bacterium]
MSEVTLREAQEAVDKYIQTVGVRYFSELSNLAQLVEEVGEVARVMNRTFGDQSTRGASEQHDLADELADVLAVLLAIANQTGTDLTAAFLANLDKKVTRDRDRHRNNTKLTMPDKAD